ncbi:uncharacterized protein LOC122962887 [Acropora millepora]|uniref:uncharacterized protein LOC122962887 n=1 Tax=Acropora millepora TaxID=45264 RepID=UPI001CF2208B|nr:uncharacterized protein LOC122962887 [Acropora millepora]
MRSVSRAFTPDLEEDINIAGATYKLSGIVCFNGIHYWCEILSTQIGYKNGWYFFDGMQNGGKAEYVGDTPKYNQPQYVHILLYEQWASNTLLYDNTLAQQNEKLKSIISSYKEDLNHSDTKVKIKNLKAILKHERIPFQINSKLDDLKPLVLNKPDTKAKDGFKIPMKVSVENRKTPPCPTAKDVFSLKQMSGTQTGSKNYTPERQAPKKLKREFLAPFKKIPLKKNIQKCIRTFKDPSETSQNSSGDESDETQFNGKQD